MRTADWILMTSGFVLAVTVIYAQWNENLMTGPQENITKAQRMNQILLIPDSKGDRNVDREEMIRNLQENLNLERLKNSIVRKEIDKITHLFEKIFLESKSSFDEIDRRKKDIVSMYEQWPSYKETSTSIIASSSEKDARKERVRGPVATPAWKPLDLASQQKDMDIVKESLSAVNHVSRPQKAALTEEKQASSTVAGSEKAGASATKARRQHSISSEMEKILSGFQIKPIERGIMVIVPGADIFVRNSRDLADSARQILQPIATAVKSSGEFRLEIVGHTDSFKSATESKTLSRQRAELIKQFLAKEFEIDVDRMRVDGLGSDRPIASNASLDGRRANRRIEISFIN